MLSILGVAALALAGVYAYAALALLAHARLARVPPPRNLAHALAVGALMPACGCTALAYARRAPAKLRAPFLVAAYAANPLLLAAAWLLAGPIAALAILTLALLAALAARHVPEGERPRARLDDLLLRRGGNALRDALPYTTAFAAPALGIGAFVSVAAAMPSFVAGIAIGALALLFAPPHRDVAQDHGARFANGVRIAMVGLALTAAVGVVWLGAL